MTVTIYFRREFSVPNSVIVLIVFVVVSIEINKRDHMQSDLCAFMFFCSSMVWIILNSLWTLFIKLQFLLLQQKQFAEIEQSWWCLKCIDNLWWWYLSFFHHFQKYLDYNRSSKKQNLNLSEGGKKKRKKEKRCNFIFKSSALKGMKKSKKNLKEPV